MLDFNNTCPEDERWYLVDTLGFAFELPCTLKPNYWLNSLHASVHGYPLTSRQVRTDDYLRQAEPLRLEGELRGKNEADMHEKAQAIRAWTQRARYLQRGQRSSLELLEGNDIELVPSGSNSAVATLSVVLVARDRRWVNPATGQEVTG